ncbi:trypsin-like peptidase domain-containing protein [Verrucomicrobiales bacterium]|nr:trypsin-like peptidase domain-containing protein [Verrucomicrobiales bacterium]MDA7926973.1 trypsin-like peptidase domain-containing protein [Verrucomicrobiales bacterium]
MKHLAAMLAACALIAGSSQAGQFGTGFAVNSDGVFVTCHHVVKNSAHVVVHTPTGPLAARVIAVDRDNDLAILHVQGWNGRYLGLKSAETLDYASSITVAGFPDPTVLGRKPKVTMGRVNALSGVRDDPRLIQISAPVQPGNSGGPVVSDTGQVVGVVAAGLDSMDRMENGGYVPQAVNYAVKTDLIIALLNRHGIRRATFGTKTTGDTRQVRRVVSSIALVEGVSAGERSSLIPARNNQASAHPQRQLRPVSTAPAPRHGPWIFVNSHARKLMTSEVHNLPTEVLWRARNEIYLRHGYIFATERGRRFAQSFAGNYRPVTTSVETIKTRLNEAEIHNLRLIASFEQNG